MMSNDGWFWAGVSGKRAENIQQLQNNIAQWRQHVADLEQVNDNVRRSRLFWFRAAVSEGGEADALLEMFKEATGKTPTEYYGKEEKERRFADAKRSSKDKWLKKWDVWI